MTGAAGTSRGALPRRGRGHPLGFADLHARHGRRVEATVGGQHGETLVETLVTIVLLGLTVVALLAGFVTVARLVDRNGRVTHAGNTAQSYAEQLKQPVDGAVDSMSYQPCDEGVPDYRPFAGALPSGDYTAEVTAVRYAATVGGGGATVRWSESCPGEDQGLQLLVVDVTVESGGLDIVESVAVVKRDARCAYSEAYENTDQGPC